MLQTSVVSHPEPMLYLASQSPRRSQILQQMNIRHQVWTPPDADAAEALEVTISGESPDDYAQRVALAKWHHCGQGIRMQKLPAQPVLCADTTVAVDGQILGKPRDAEDARRMLGLLSGRCHEVHTAIVLGLDTPFCALNTSKVTFMKMENDQIEAYLATGEAMGKAGAYAIQGQASCYIARIEGSYSGIMGLPVFELSELLRQHGLVS